MLTVYSETNMDSTSISNLFIDEYMRDANDAQIKVYLYLVRMMSAHRATTISDMADRFNHTEKEVLRSLKYWEKRGLLELEYDGAGKLSGIHLSDPEHLRHDFSGERVISITPVLSARAAAARVPASSLPPASFIGRHENAGDPSGCEDTAEDPSASPLAEKTALSGKDSSGAAARASSRGRKTRQEQDEMPADERKRAQLLFIVEQYIGKPLSVREVETICSISDDLHFSDDLIDYLVQYCVDRGKKDFRYIEKVALNWAQEGISTPRQAQRAVSAFPKGRKSRGKVSDAGAFTKITRHDYDFEALEKAILEED